MPQLDLMTFFTQFIWFSLSFSIFYIFMLYSVVPRIAFNLKFRKKKLEYLSIDINKKKENVLTLLTTYDNLLLKSLNLSRTYINKALNNGNFWIKATTSEVYKIDVFISANNNFLKTISEKNFNLILLDQVLKSSPKDSNWTKLWI
uniref:ATP synthase F0 subunit 8 n=1 Tax=Cryptomonas gyropyrenoidosa TaxID=233257 RepID=UPI0027A90134|nr:ATP synthase F0 subunit 8 [Cryptomonas gyropyrenoidosa]WFQ82677.1 ATP synthase F0 subunit 8 [Cryptomonas gyropyrenoidosa]